MGSDDLNASLGGGWDAIEFVKGAQGTICVSGVTHVAERGQDFQVRLYGDAGSLELDFNFARSQLRGLHKVKKSGMTFRFLWSSWDRVRILRLGHLTF